MSLSLLLSSSCTTVTANEAPWNSGSRDKGRTPLVAEPRRANDVECPTGRLSKEVSRRRRVWSLFEVVAAALGKRSCLDGDESMRCSEPSNELSRLWVRRVDEAEEEGRRVEETEEEEGRRVEETEEEGRTGDVDSAIVGGLTLDAISIDEIEERLDPSRFEEPRRCFLVDPRRGAEAGGALASTKFSFLTLSLATSMSR